ncbi:hypothetical protein J2787_002827 [Chryseobacterium rhizosphaerae]|uniref:Uncharacterized protein n=1 Tax=Chryseobacterium rhizosphaerae TaxID=395937 RepID=A0AAE4C586_9FLAO|nr:hypothetical protein [Chryseobacterium rhizosphaerae]MDR6527435.1 hypothetical protein [Chryseobacterium rhizosphaerae]
MSTVFNLISVASAFMFGVGLLYWIMDATIGKLKFLHSDKEWNGMQYKDLIFILFSAVLLLSVFDFYKPY